VPRLGWVDFSGPYSTSAGSRTPRALQPVQGDEAIHLTSSELAMSANSAAGPGHISTHPACLNSPSVNPPQSTPMVRMFAFPAASASQGVSLREIPLGDRKKRLARLLGRRRLGIVRSERRRLTLRARMPPGP
jgi:hypothetical protein